MPKEIERKFLVRDTSILNGRTGRRLVQGYISTTPNTTRVRIIGDTALLTIKGPPSGISCEEFEAPWPLVLAQEMLTNLCGDRVIEKTRYEIPVGERTFEVDVFHGAWAGLVLAEVELPSVDALVAIPDWVGLEVSGDRQYTNACMALGRAEEQSAMTPAQVRALFPDATITATEFSNMGTSANVNVHFNAACTRCPGNHWFVTNGQLSEEQVLAMAYWSTNKGAFTI